MATKFITVSIEIMHDTDLNQSQKFLLAEIEQLSTLDKGCIASNLHFSTLIGITKENISRNLKGLADKGYIEIEIINGSRNHNRVITLLSKRQDPLTTLVRPPYQSSKTPLLKRQETKENIHSNRVINNKEVFSLEITEKLKDYPLANKTAFFEWVDAKKYKTIAPITKLLNMLSKYNFEIQQQIVDNSIMNEYQGLFPPRQNTKSFKQQDQDQDSREFEAISQNNIFDVIDNIELNKQNETQGVICE